LYVPACPFCAFRGPSLTPGTAVVGGAGQLLEYGSNFGPSDLGHLVLGTQEILDGIAVTGIGVVGSGFCFAGVSTAPVVGQVFGYPACGALAVGSVSAGTLSVYLGLKQYSEIDLTDCEGIEDFFE
jgi:hypothetical protein